MFNLKEKFLGLFSKKIKCLYINGVITVTLLSKEQLVFTKMTKQEYEIISKFTTDEEVKEYYDEWVILSNSSKKGDNDKQKSQIEVTKDKEVERIVERKENKAVIANYSKLVSTGDFEEVDGQLFLKPIKLSIPKLLTQKFTEIIDAVLLGEDEDKFEEYHALKNFWKWASLCANPQSREDLFKYLEHQGLTVNKYGFFFAYRKVVSVHKSGSSLDKNKSTTGDPKYVKFVSESYLKIKGQKKSPKNFLVINHEGYQLYDIKKGELSTQDQKSVLGNLLDLYNHLGDPGVQEQMFTDAYTHSMDIRIGKPVSMPPEQCDTNHNADCSRGLHIGAKSYGCGDTSLLCIVNPMNSISVPVSDGQKMRVSEYFPVAILDDNHNFNIHREAHVLELGTEYFNDQLEKLNKLVKDNKPVELVKHHLLSSNVTKEEIDQLEFSIPDIKAVIANRVINN